MFTGHTLADKASALLFEQAERRLEALLAEHGVSDPNELPLALQRQLLQRAIAQTDAASIPRANREMFRHGVQSFIHPAFFDALDRTRVSLKSNGDAFGMARGVYAAVVLAGYGLPVGPLDAQASGIRAEPSNDIDTVLALFSSDKGAFVGYNCCEAPFYVLLTDCVQSLRRLVPNHPWLSGVKELFARAGQPLPPDPGQSFVHGVYIIDRQPGDTTSTVLLIDSNPTQGSIFLNAGWQIGGEPRGAPNQGYVPVPVQLLRAVVNDPRVAYSFWKKGGAPMPLH
jgi:hypothetical protein